MKAKCCKRDEKCLYRSMVVVYNKRGEGEGKKIVRGKKFFGG